MVSHKKIGIIGGTFDPIHNGHLIIAQDAMESFGLDRIIFMPSGHSYFKDGRAEEVSSPIDRFQMTKAAIEGTTGFTVSDMEIRRNGDTHTCETMEQLVKTDPSSDYYFICGADSVAQMKMWYHPERLFRVCKILTAVRSDEVGLSELENAIEELKSLYAADIHIISSRNIEISSTEIRRRVSSGKSIRYFVPETVMKYIQENELYK